MLSLKELERYNRQVIFKKIGLKGQEKLKKSKALLAGLGGLGSIISTYLVRAGIGELIIIDDDIVELSNLQRQILYDETDIGQIKVKVAEEKLKKMNKNVKLKAVNARITKSNVLRLAKNCDLILDGTDNMESRFIMNEASIKLSIPFIHAAIEKNKGVSAVFMPGKACFACVYKESKKKQSIGVIGPAPGVAGSLSASQAIHILSGITKPEKSFITVFSLHDNKFDTLMIRRNPKCVVCRK